MKVYATVTSERASKGQGGQWLNITLQGEGTEHIAFLRLAQSEAEPDKYMLDIQPEDNVEITIASKDELPVIE